jgi:hypothetical protein
MGENEFGAVLQATARSLKGNEWPGNSVEYDIELPLFQTY